MPAHVGVPGNEETNDAALAAAKSLLSASTLRGQPKIPLNVAIAILRRGQREWWQQQWIRRSLYRLDFDHLSRVKPGIECRRIYFTGSRHEQTILARLRLGHCGLATSESRWCPFVSCICACGFEQETVEHFLLRCPNFDTERAQLVQDVRNVFDGPITEELLLGGGSQAVDFEDRVVISDSVFRFVQRTGRDI